MVEQKFSKTKLFLLKPHHKIKKMPGVLGDYRTIAAEKQAQRQKQIPEQWLLSKDYSSLTNVMDVPLTCGILSDAEIDITSNFDATALLEKLETGVWSAEQVTIAFCKRAAIAHQLVSPKIYRNTSRAIHNLHHASQHCDHSHDLRPVAYSSARQTA